MVDINKIDDTYAEAFAGIYTRIVITADNENILRRAAEDSTSTPSVVIGRVEGGIEKWLDETETPDKRKGVLLQFWGAIQPGKTIQASLLKFESELSYRIRQDILVKPFTAVFNALSHPEGRMDMMLRVGHCGDGFEWIENRYGKEVHEGGKTFSRNVKQAQGASRYDKEPMQRDQCQQGHEPLQIDPLKG